MSQTHLRPQNGWLVLLDAVCLIVSFSVAILLRFPNDVSANVMRNVDGWIIFFVSVILANYLGGSYRVQYTFSRFNLVVTWIFSMFFAALLVSITSFAWFSFLLGRGVFAYAVLSYGALSLYVRLVVYHTLFRGNYFLRRAVIIGDDPLAEYCNRSVANPYVLPRNSVVAYVHCCTEDTRNDVDLIDGVPAVSCRSDTLSDVVQGFHADVVLLANQSRQEVREVYPQLRRIHYQGAEVLTALAVGEIYRGKLLLELLDDDEIIRLHMESGLPFISQFKRVFDILSSLFALVLTLPVWLIVPLLLKLTGPRLPVFYVQTRVGRFGAHFQILKFRTMRPPKEGETKQIWSGEDDPRITRVGYYLRKYRIDEIPQFINILRGDMSLVGPRPEQPDLVLELARDIRYYREREMVPPGLTGWAQIHYPYGNSVEDARRKLEYDLYYVKNLSISLDFQIVLRTVRIVLFGKEKRADMEDGND